MLNTRLERTRVATGARRLAVSHHGHEFEPFGEPRPLSFGPYAVLGELGCGGMGVVYRALDTRLQRQVAVKVLHRELSVSEPRERFLREARLASSLNHPGICTVFDFGEQDGDPYLVMELLNGESVKERLGRGPMAPHDVREVAFRVALALQAAHARGIVHRDIKPANLFLVKDGQGSLDVKVLDFGLAKLAEAGSRAGTQVNALTRTGATVGTVEYMSPEQACGEPVDARSDLFSLGAVLYEMATGSVPFRGTTSAVVFSELLNRDPTPPRSRNLQVPSDLDALIRALLTKDRARRLGSATEMLDALVAMEAGSRDRALVNRPSRGASVHTTRSAAARFCARSGDADAGQPDSGRAHASRGRASEALQRQTAAVEISGSSDPVPGRHPGSGVRTAAGNGTPRYAGDTVHPGWKVALGCGVAVAVLLTLLVIVLTESHPAQVPTTQRVLQQR